ncbi:MAG: para-aminobenzoate synthetase / 4-amino-4-deoxychorismate lyase, partial [Solirubrobacteraceae bacterium]|nr:para-aminobenzoate synthetase / 4-amino-4-deoxychorismate lyase [Solirubrobacteraceae bacterium]
MIRNAGDRTPAASAWTETARLVREPLHTDADPLAAVRWLRGEPRAVALSGVWAGGGLLMTSHPVTVAAPDEDPFALLGARRSVDVDDGESEVGEPVRDPVRDPAPVPARDPAPDPVPVGGGWFGWLGFELARSIERVPPPPPRPQPLPPFDLAYH